MSPAGEPAAENELREWIQRARGGDSAARDRLCRHFLPRISAYVERHMGARARRWSEPGDIVQRVLMETLASLDGLPANAGEEDVLKRIYTTASSRIRDSVRNHARDAGESILDEVARAQEASKPSTGSVTRDDVRKLISDLLVELPPELGEVLRLCALEGLSFVAAGQRLALTPDAIRKRYDRARKVLASKLSADEHG